MTNLLEGNTIILLAEANACGSRGHPEPAFERGRNLPGETKKGWVEMTLDRLRIGQNSKILEVRGEGALRRRLLDMGLTPHTAVMIRKVAPMGDPIEIHLRGYELTLRIDDAKKIEVEEGESK